MSGLAVHQLLHRRELAARLSLDEIAGDGERSAAESDHRLVVAQRRTHEPHGLENRRHRLFGLRHDQALHVGEAPHRLGDHRADVLDEVDLNPHRKNGEHDVREHHRRVHVVPADGLQRHLGAELRLGDDVEQPVTLPQLAVLGQRPACLAHEPHRRVLHRLTATGPDEKRLHDNVG